MATLDVGALEVATVEMEDGDKGALGTVVADPGGVNVVATLGAACVALDAPAFCELHDASTAISTNPATAAVDDDARLIRFAISVPLQWP